VRGRGLVRLRLTSLGVPLHQGHEGVVEDVAWHGQHPQLFGSVGDDRRLLVWDIREPHDKPSHRVDDAMSSYINCMAFSPHSEFIFVTGSNDKTISLWDLRSMKKSLHSFVGHRWGD
jgi:histone-binding protein RBBP4